MSYRVLVLLLLFCTAGVGCRTTEGTADPPGNGRDDAAGPVRLMAPAPRPSDAGSAAVAEPTGVVTLPEAVAFALMNHPRLSAFSYDVRAAEARALQTQLRPNPELAVDVEGVGGTGDYNGVNAAETTIQLGQLIELGRKRQKRGRLAALDVELARWDAESKRLDVMLTVTQAFVGVLAAQERVTLAERLGDLAGEAQSTVAQRVAAGKDSPVDELRAGVALSRTQIQVRKAQEALAAAHQRLAASWGSRRVTFAQVTGDFHAIAQTTSFEQAAAAIVDNPDVARWKAQEQQRRAALALAKAEARSDVTVAGGLRHFQETDDAALVFGVAVPIPVFNRNQGGIREATEMLAKARAEQRADEVRIRAALSEAVHRLSSAHHEAQVLQRDVLPAAQRASETACQGHREGKFDYLYVLDTQRTFFETKGQYLDALETYHKARADVERLIGKSIDSLNSTNGESSEGISQ